MNCFACKAANPEGKKFCGDCGASLNPDEARMDQYLGPRIESYIQKQYKDQKLVEIDVTEAVVTKISGWAKVLGYVAGIPLTLFALILGFLGIKTYSDFSSVVNAGKQEITKTFQTEHEKAQQQAQAFRQQAEVFKTDSEQLTHKSDELKTKYQQLESQLSGIDTLAQNLETLTTKVEKLEERVGFQPSAALTPALKTQLEASFSNYINYLRTIGFRAKTDKVRVFIDPKEKTNAYYNPSRNLIVIAPALARDKQVAYREYTHHALAKYLPTDSVEALALESALADYFACSFSNNPLLGEEAAKALKAEMNFQKGYIRNLSNDRKFTAPTSRNNYMDAGEIWGGAFWELRNLIGQTVFDKLLLSTWERLRRADLTNNLPVTFVNKLLDTHRSLGGQQAEQIRAVFVRRGINV